MYKIVFRTDPDTNKSVKVMNPVSSDAEFRALRDSERNRSVLSKVRAMYAEYFQMISDGVDKETLKAKKDLIDKEKGYLVQMNYSCIPGSDMLLKGSSQCSPWVGMDVDFDPADPLFEQKMREAPARIIAMKDQLGLGMLERSTGKGYHLVFRRHLDLTQEENLRWASDLIGCMFDEAAKDITRVFFSTSASADDLLFLNPDLFLPEANEPVASVNKPAETATQPTPAENSADPSPSATPNPAAYSYMEFTYEQIIDKYWEMYNGGQTPREGARETLTYELALNLRCICDFSMERLSRIIPRYDGLPEADWRKALSSACNAEHKGMTYRMRQVLKALKDEQKKDIMPWGMNSATPPLYTHRLPEPLRKVTDTTPDHLKTTVSEGSFGALATHLHGVTFHLIDGTECEPALMQILIYQQSKGKGSIDKPIECILEDLKAHDDVDRQRENEWKQANPSGKSKKKPRPKDIYIQICQSDMTHAAFVQRLIDAHNNGQRPLFIHMQELDEITALSTNGKKDVSRIIRKGFDRKSYGQERVGADSVTGVAPLRLNFTAATTPIRARQMCMAWVGDGTLSRCNLLTIDPQETPTQPRYKPVTKRYKDSLAPYIARLNNAEGLIRCRKAEQLAERLRAKLEDEYAGTDSESLSTFAPRAITIAYYKAMILYIMQGKWTKDIEHYVEWSLKRDLWVKMHYFGKKLEDDIQQEHNMITFHPKNILECLPDTFSEEQFKQARDQNGLRGDYKEHLKKLRQRHKIDFDETTHMYVKVAA